MRLLLRAHPRSRGEHKEIRFRVGAQMGSSPLARGTLRRSGPGDAPKGLIPARAGNTNSLEESNPTAWAHPRSRGEHPISPLPSSGCSGSSPLARGTQDGLLDDSYRSGLIPARAGNTSRTSRISAMIWAHPRSRGEHALAGASDFVIAGSSPLARGTLHLYSRL